MIKELLQEAQDKMDQAVVHTAGEFSLVRTGRANPGILSRIMVDYYGTATPLQQIAGFSVPEARMLVVQPYDKTSIPAIERAIHEADLGLNPSNDGRVVRIPIPPLTEERRKEMVKLAHDMAEACRNSVRQARREGNDALKGLEKEKEISQDDEKRGHDQVQKLHDRYISDINETLEHKEKDIMEV